MVIGQLTLLAKKTFEAAKEQVARASTPASRIKWVRLYDTRQDEFSLHAHRKLFERFQGDKIELTSNLTASRYKLEG